MKTLVTGANGFIGSHLCERLLALGHAVRGLARRSSDLRWLAHLTPAAGCPTPASPPSSRSSFELAFGDVRDLDSLHSAAADIEVVFHLGASVRARDTREFEHVNCTGTKLLAEACIESGVRRLVLFSSAAAGGPAPGPDAPRHEAQAPSPVSRYGRGKLGAEQALQELHDRLHSVILRLPAVYGPRDRDVARMLRWVRRGFLPVFGGSFSAVYVGDAVQAALLAAERPVASGSVYYITDGNCYTYDDVSAIAAEVLGRRPLRVPVPRWLVHVAAWASDKAARSGSIFNPDKARELTQACWVCCPDKARAELGFAPSRTLATGMAETIRWYQEMNWL